MFIHWFHDVTDCSAASMVYAVQNCDIACLSGVTAKEK